MDFEPGERRAEAPIRAELFSTERLEQHAEALAATHAASSRPKTDRRLVARVLANRRVLTAAYRAIAANARDERTLAPAAEWLVDNFFVVEEQIRAIQTDLPPSFSRQLPKLKRGDFAGLPRVYALAWSFVAHTDSRFDPDPLRRFVTGYQKVQVLTIGELWAIAIALRIVLVENLRRLAEQILASEAARRDANRLANRLLGADGEPAEPAQKLLERSTKPLSPAFAVQLIQRLREQDPRTLPALAWLHQRLSTQGSSVDAVVREVQQDQGAANVTIRNIITSMRAMSAVDWREWVEGVSRTDAMLAAASDFASFDFPTRDRYRGAIEQLARGANLTETAVTQRAIAAAQIPGAQDAPAPPSPAYPAASDSHHRDPGYHLIGAGRPAFERALGYRLPLGDWLVRANAKAGIAGYLGAASLVTALAVGLALVAAGRGVSPGALWLLALAAVLPASDAAFTLVNRAVTRRFPAIALPGLALRRGVPADLRTLVVVPALLTTTRAIAALIERLEVHHLANDDGDITFALLSDWTDAATETTPADATLLQQASLGIEALNRRYGAPHSGGQRFLLLHRRRRWNPGEAKWMGWERKRGKLHALNRLLRGAPDTGFIGVDGAPTPSLGRGTVPAQVRFVVVLDADTRLPRGAVRRLVGKIAHPLNRPVFDPALRRVVQGYAVLQPRVTQILPEGAEGSVFQRIFSNAGGIDPYVSAVSDVYQDLFGEGSFVGKGIYEIDPFEAALAGRVPDNCLLSHDLLEGTFARAGLVSDIEVVDDFPARYEAAMARHHRWVRGDWQLLPWIVGRGPNPGSQGAANGAPGAALRGTARRVPAVGRWKMLDNLRRSLSAPAALFALAAGWLCPGVSALGFSGFVVLTLALPLLLGSLSLLLPGRPRISLALHLRAGALGLRRALAQFGLVLAFLPHEAWVNLDAILRTLYRLAVSRRRLLEWLSDAEARASPGLSLQGYYAKMAGAIAASLALGLLVASIAPGNLQIALPFLLLWSVAPALARAVSLPSAGHAEPPLAAADVAALRLVGRRTWRFFESFVTDEEHHLPPDNFQEDPRPVVAHRTSPTNLGLYLLSVVSARDFGWIGLCEMVERLEATLAAMQRLERHRGHFYNWYATLDLRPLDPRYISSVDSGNLAGHLVALWGACAEIAAAPLLPPDWRRGVADGVELTRRALNHLPPDLVSETRTALETALHDLAALLEPKAISHDEAAPLLRTLAAAAAVTADLARGLAQQRHHPASVETAAWAASVVAAVASHQRDLQTLLVPDDALAPDAAAIRAPLPSLAELAAAPASPAAESASRAAALLARLDGIAAVARSLFHDMKFDFLFDPERELLSIGFRVEDASLDPATYDLLASEARLGSFVAIAKGELPARHWFRLGRLLAPAASGAALISWSGSMFEYLMPSLVMRAPHGSLLAESSRQMLRQQMVYGRNRGVPWGASESAFNARDLEFTYQYGNFGIPELALKRGLGDDTVIAPYATALAAMLDPRHAVTNLAGMAALGGRGRYGWYEALDFTRARLPEGKRVAVIRSYMAHHQGMTLVALANALLSGVMRRRFHADPMVQATELLLQERMPRDVTLALTKSETFALAAKIREPQSAIQRRIDTPHSAVPQTHLLSNGSYGVMITAAGSGYSRRRGVALTRWREDAVRDPWGSFIYLRDLRSLEVWSAGFQPTGVRPDRYEVAFSEGRAEIVRQDGALTTTLEVVVSSEDDCEVRRVSIRNRGREPRDIELTSYIELVLASQADDDAHPAFSKLFVETERLSDAGLLLATRRHRTPDEPSLWAGHFTVAEGSAGGGEIAFETDRARFLGRGRGPHNPQALEPGGRLTGTVGTVLDPIFSLRRVVRVPPAGTVRVAFWTVLANSRTEAIDLADKHRAAIAFERAGTLAWTQAQVELRHLGIGAGEAHAFQRLAGRVIYSDPSLRPLSDSVIHGAGAASMLWALGVSGDLPIVLLRIDQGGDLAIVRELLLAHEYWRMKNLAVDLVILNEQPSSYAQDFQTTLEQLARLAPGRPQNGGDGSLGRVYLLRADLVTLELRELLHSVARAVLAGHRGPLAEQVRSVAAPRRANPRRAVSSPAPTLAVPPAPRAEGLEFFNGLGGFAEHGREYRVRLDPGRTTPAPWINVVSNPEFGFLCSAEGGGTSWSLDSQQNHITPWSNDPVTDPPGEILYVRDDDSGDLWGPTAQPVREPWGSYVASHGAGYSRFEYESHGIRLELLQTVPVDDAVKLSRLRVTERSMRPRRLSVTAYVEWVLGRSRGADAAFVVTGRCPDTGALLARNPWNNEFGRRVAFADLGGARSVTGDRSEFLGRNGTLDQPAALGSAAPLSNRVGATLAPCAALQTKLELAPGGNVDILFLLGEAADAAAAAAMVRKYRALDPAAVLDRAVAQWDGILNAVEVTTPDRAMDIMLNRWLLYQTLACRIWARSGFYQASGAYGFRDQLQDVMALCVARPAIAREHLLRAAGRQFAEGDVQHWWLPDHGRGIRTRIADDRIWLAYVAHHYTTTTGDLGVLDEKVPFLEGPKLRDGEGDAFFQPTLSDHQASLFDHCALALDASLAVGSHGLPLIGTGDWNDGMNRIGAKGQGESVWLAWFLHATLISFSPIAEARGENRRTALWRAHAASLAQALEQHGWDGAWYRRAYFDDGTPLGTAADDECRIDAIAQSWSVISGAAPADKARQAMASVETLLTRKDLSIAPLFTPPFDRTARDPGYIKGYPPGIRENGGQYTHAATWSVFALAGLGEGDQAAELFAMLNPINHARTEADANRYKVEPYAVCADVYSEPPHAGRGGWTWYTGSSGWLYRAGLEAILGFRLHGKTLLLDPCIPRHWPEFSIRFRYRAATYRIRVHNPGRHCRGVRRLEIDGTAAADHRVVLEAEGEHRVEVTLGVG